MPGMRSLSSMDWLPIVTVALADVIPILYKKTDAESAHRRSRKRCSYSSRARTGPSGFGERRTKVICSLGIHTFTPTLML